LEDEPPPQLTKNSAKANKEQATIRGRADIRISKEIQLIISYLRCHGKLPLDDRGKEQVLHPRAAGGQCDWPVSRGFRNLLIFNHLMSLGERQTVIGS
jgi:hypothetical protein